MKEEMYKAELINHQLEQIEQDLQELAHKASEVHQLKQSLDELDKLSRGDEMLAPLAPGIFLHATYAGKKDLLVNVGQGNVVPKSSEQIKEMLELQLEELRKYEEHLRSEFERLFSELKSTQQGFE